MSPHRKAPPPTGLKRLVFTLLMPAFPVALVLLCEIILRLAHYGPDLSLFTRIVVGGNTYLIMNPAVGQRYFPGTEFSPATSSDAFPLVKAPGTFRIFCLGGSTTAGYPYWFNGAFSAFLRTRLHALFPDRKIEVINCGLTATNSFTVLDFTREVTEAGADLIIVYDGHNEFYGALGVASRESPTGFRALTELSLGLLRFRTYVLVRDCYAGIRRALSPGATGEDRGTMMERLSRGEYIPYRGRRYAEALGTFRENIRATAALCAARGVPLILGTQVSNVRTIHPFVSIPRTGLTPPEVASFNASLEAGLNALDARDPGRGIGPLRGALAIDSLRGDAAYALARCLDGTGDKSGARAEYIRARDLDQLRFRASTDFNDAIREAARPPDVAVVDMEALFAGASADSIVGTELIFEHLHPTARGAFLMAKAYAHAMEGTGLIAAGDSWRARDTTPDEKLWDQRPITPLDERIAERKVAILTSAWPFREGVPVVPAVSPADTLGQIVEHVTRSRWTWEQAHEAALAYYRRAGDRDAEEREFRTIISQMPLDIQPQLALARFYMERGNLVAMASVLEATLQVVP
ncbi:MAG TPA: SGNH/GDSL hydrolase family protein, partial [Bacteroidota bacterium]|nr:SGNH/GDSL hydrolase family protein [Bacteroidota bacterium]